LTASRAISHHSNLSKRLREKEMEIDLPEVVAEVRAEFEGSAGANDVAALNAMFHKDSRIIRYGGNENLYGYD
jgi:1-carboxybiuret hydrolase subunit AtzH-like protein